MCVSLSDCSKWLIKRCRWRASELVWSVHHPHSRLDRAGKTNSQGFKFVSHSELSAIGKPELTSNKGCFSVGRVWTRTKGIPMGNLG